MLLAVGLIGAGFPGGADFDRIGGLWGIGGAGLAVRLRTRSRGVPSSSTPIIAVATVVGMAINFLGINPIQALFWASVINGFVAPPLLVILMLIGNNKKVMGERRPMAAGSISSAG